MRCIRIARIACKFEHTIYVVSKHISANIIFHQGERPMSAPTDYTLLLLYKNYMYKHIKTGCGIIQNLGSSVLHNKLNLYIAGFFLFWY